jgi:hypothetical protein
MYGEFHAHERLYTKLKLFYLLMSVLEIGTGDIFLFNMLMTFPEIIFFGLASPKFNVRRFRLIL